MEKERLDLSAIRTRLAETQGPQRWRSLEELAQTEAFQELLQREFPQHASVWPHLDRRNFLKLMGASLALAGLTACSSEPPEKILPYVRPPAEVVPGKPLFFATAMPLGGYGTGLLVESHLGRPTKVEGNPLHPASLGATDLFNQASILSLYDPDRAQQVSEWGQTRSWQAFLASVRAVLENQRASGGAGIRILTETVSSPSLAGQLAAFLETFPAATWHQYEPLGRDNERAGANLAFGRVLHPRYRFDQAERILALDADFLAPGRPGNVRYARDFAERRRLWAGQTEMNRLYVIESTPTMTGAVADHRLPLRAGQVEGVTRALAQALGIAVEPGEVELPENQTAWLAAMARDLQAHQGSSLILPGAEQPPLVHALAHALNATLNNVGQTVVYSEPVEAKPVDQLESLRDLVEAMAGGQVDLLLSLSGNPVLTAPVDFDFAAQLANVGLAVHLSLYADETSQLCRWHLPETHYLEQWGDVRAYDGTVSIIQPLINPLYENKSALEVIAALRGEADPPGYDLVRGFWENQSGASDNFEQFWQQALSDGVVPGSELPPVEAAVRADFAAQGPPPAAAPAGASPDELTLEINFRPDPSLWDGRFAPNSWLQELPKPLTKLTWDNAALVSPATAERLDLNNEELVQLHFRERVVTAPVWIVPGQPDESVTVYLGYGRTQAGLTATALGFNAYSIRASEALWFGSGLELTKTGQEYPLATTQNHHSLAPPDERLDLIVRHGTLAEFQENPDFVKALSPHPEADKPSLYPEFSYPSHSWGMAIDLTACTGCNACVVACQAENNIPVVGKEGVALGREMHWLRIDTYFEGNLDNPYVYQQPMLCQHCEKAPCEVVCPVAATVHDAEGLNEMIYNRCIGTRYCSNNCPYKVRRFNYLEYTPDIPVLNLMRNPEVTVRDRGVMEKCTYCIQRISAARIEARRENRSIRDGEVVTACQAACPTRAIVFGNLNNPESQVVQLKSSPLNYGVLAELNTQPRTTYLAAVKNLNPEIDENRVT